MSDYTMDDSPSAQQQHGNDATLHNTSLDDQNAANNSIIGKVKSRVSSILPNSLSKWFSPSSKLSNETFNGGTRSAGNVARRRRRIEVDDDEDEDYEEDYQGERGEYEENHNLVTKKEENSENEDDDNEDDDGEEDDESQNSEVEYNATLAAQKVRHTNTTCTIRDRQPPAKRCCLSTDIRDSPLLAPRQPLIASTPAVGSSSYARSSIGGTVNSSASRSSTYQRYSNLNPYKNTAKREPAYNFGQHQNIGSPKTNSDIIDLITNSNETSEKLFVQGRGELSNRRSLNIPSFGRVGGTEHVAVLTIPQFKRQPLSTSKCDLSASSSPAGVPPRRTSTTIHELRESEENSEHDDDFSADVHRNVSKFNGQTMVGKQSGGNINGSEFNRPNANEPAEGTLDSASESGESSSAYLTKSVLQNPQRKTGLFNTNMSMVTTRNSSRTSSFGNGLNFYSHLEGRKSLFTGQGHSDSNQINNSTLSLTSLNRRQFNASIYGSTSALSDSRLLNTFSPFYKGKTTYGGAAAYNKYSASSGGANAVRITPTLIRPTSSISTLSSSSCSLSNNTHISQQQHQIGDSATISSTAKRILDLINDFATPLSEAKKMANNLKMTPSASHLRDRLNENDLNTSRAIRLSQVRTPYSRPSVILLPSGNANTSTRGGPQPPVKELQVPTMSQLLQMKKIQTTTEKMRTITRDNSHLVSEYTLPTIADECNKFGAKTKTPPPSNTPQTKGGFIDQESQQQQHQQKHTNKIKNKVSNTLRASAASKDLQDEAPPPTVNLPTLAFPLMQSVPKFDIQFSSVASTNESTSTTATKTSASTSGLSTTKVPTIQTAFNTKTITSVSANSFPLNCGVDSISSKSVYINFKFSEPLVVKEHTQQNKAPLTSTSINYKFSPPLSVSCPVVATKPLQQQQPAPQLRTSGSCLDVFNKPLPIALMTATTTSESFGDKFKKSSNDWECDTCMIRNELSQRKCVACETPRKESQGQEKSSIPIALSLGQQFKKSSSEWECDTCMIRNKEESKNCVACETPRKGVLSLPTPPTVKNKFGDAFKTKSGTWECPTCMIANKQDDPKCVACETSKPGSSNARSTSTAAAPAVTSTFKFGFSTPQIAGKEMPVADSGFQTIVAQQKAAKWECDACMTRNDSERTKCACCEQPKPGSNVKNENSSFSFGATSASKFSFGFGAASKEEDLRKENAMNATNKTPSSIGALSGINTASSAMGGFQFGFKTTAAATVTIGDKSKDEADSKNNQSSSSIPSTVGFKCDSITNNNKPNVSEITSTATKTSSGFSFGNKLNTTNATSTAAGPTLSFNSPTTSSSTTKSLTFGVNKPSDSEVETSSLTFGPTSTASSTTEGFSFGVVATKKESSPLGGVEKKSQLTEFAFKTPAAVSSSSASATTSSKISTPATTTTTELVFGSNIKPTIPTTVATAICNTTTTTTSSTAVSTAAVKPMFSFGSKVTLSQGSTAASTTPAGTGFGGFSFNSPSTSASSFGAVTSSTSSNTATTTSTSSSSTAPASTTTSIFGSFGGKSTSTSLTFGSPSAANVNPANNSTIVSSSSQSSSNSSFSLSAKPTFGSFGSGTNSSTTTAATTNVFGSFSGTSGSTSNQILNSSQTQQNKPIASVLGNVTSTKNSSNSNSASASNNATNTFVFGSAAAPAASSATTSTWPKNSFVFGSGVNTVVASATTANTNTTPSTNVSTDGPKPTTVFGSFNSGTDNTSNQQATLSSSSSIFGNASASSNLPLATPTFGNTVGGSSAGSTNLFASANATPVSSNIFGANHSGNAATPAPAFGSSPFGGGGGSASSTSAIPTFGSTAAMTASSTSFGGFGAPASKTMNGPEIKKSEPAFSFGSSAQTPSGGFNFSSSSAKPAFNFGSTSATQATFNFTGSTETTPNTPFQFNAGSVPVSSNIFAPAPTPGTQTAQQAKRKIRAPLKRVTQR